MREFEIGRVAQLEHNAEGIGGDEEYEQHFLIHGMVAPGQRQNMQEKENGVEVKHRAGIEAESEQKGGEQHPGRVVAEDGVIIHQKNKTAQRKQTHCQQQALDK